MNRKLKRYISFVITFVLLLATPAMAGEGDIYYTGLRDTLNSIPLEPKTTGYEELDNLVADILSQIITEDMDTHDKLKACYDYLIDNTEYGVPSGLGYEIAEKKESNFVTCVTVGEAYDILNEHKGVCDHFASAFLVLVRAIGIDVKSVIGETHSSNGAFVPHAWAQIDYNGTIYIFDPQVESNIRNSTETISYTRFGGTKEQLSDKYNFVKQHNVIFE